MGIFDKDLTGTTRTGSPGALEAGPPGGSSDASPSKALLQILTAVSTVFVIKTKQPSKGLFSIGSTEPETPVNVNLGKLLFKGGRPSAGITVVPKDTDTIEHYVPEPPPGTQIEESAVYVYREYIRLSILLEEITKGYAEETNVDPEKPRDGDIRLADGTNWNPGSGQGFYGYYNAQWNKLG